MAIQTICDKCKASHGSLDGNVNITPLPIIEVKSMRIEDRIYDICNRCRAQIVKGLSPAQGKPIKVVRDFTPDPEGTVC